MLHAVVNRLSVHHFQVLPQEVLVRNLRVANGVWVLLRVFGVDAVHLGRFEQHISFDLASTQRGGGVGRHEGTAGAGGQDDDSAFFQMADTASANERLSDFLHLNRRLQPRLYAGVLERVLQREAIDDSRQHPHVVCGGCLDRSTHSGELFAAEDVSATANDRELHAPLIDDSLDLSADARDLFHVDAGLAGPAETLAADLEQDSLGSVGHGAPLRMQIAVRWKIANLKSHKVGESATNRPALSQFHLQFATFHLQFAIPVRNESRGVVAPRSILVKSKRQTTSGPAPSE